MKTELVTTLKRQATKILADLHKSKEPILITEHGKPSAYLVDVEDYETMQNRLKILEGIARGEKAVFEGRVYSESEAEERMCGFRLSVGSERGLEEGLLCEGKKFESGFLRPY